MSERVDRSPGDYTVGAFMYTLEVKGLFSFVETKLCGS